jgi:hypothetical protein
VSTSVVKWSEGLSNQASVVIGRNVDDMQFADYMAVFVYHILSYSFGSILYHFIYGCMFCMLLLNVLSYVFLLCLCIIIFMYVPFWVYCFAVLFCLFVSKCVLYYCHRVSTQMQLTNISYHRIILRNSRV